MPLEYYGAPDLLRSVQTGFNIKQARKESDLARAKYTANLEQVARENERIENDRKIKESERAYNKGLLEMKMGQKFGDIPTIERGFRNAMSAEGLELPGDFPISQESYDKFMKIVDEKNPSLQEHMAESFVTELGESVGAFARKAKGFDLDTSGFDKAQSAKDEAAKSEREMETFKEKEGYKSTLKREETEFELGLKEKAGPSTGKAQTITINNKAYERDKNGKWNLIITGPEKKTGKEPDKELRELNIMEKITKQATKAAEIKFAKYGKVPERMRWDALRQEWSENPAFTEYPFDEYTAFVNDKIEELRTKHGISDTVINSLRESVPSHDPNAPVNIPAAPTAPDLPSGYTLGEAETSGPKKGLQRVYDQNGVLKGHYQ